MAADIVGNAAEAPLNKTLSFFLVDKSSCSGVYLVTKDQIAVHRAPYDKINGKPTRNYTAYDGYKLEVIGSYINSLGNSPDNLNRVRTMCFLVPEDSRRITVNVAKIVAQTLSVMPDFFNLLSRRLSRCPDDEVITMLDHDIAQVNAL